MTIKDPYGSLSQGANQQLVPNAWVVRLLASHPSPRNMGNFGTGEKPHFWILKTRHPFNRFLAARLPSSSLG
jgi:hypothetical protein